jgi:cell division protein FtsB
MVRTLASRLLATVYVAIAAYSILAILAGPGGLIAESLLADRSAQMSANLESLRVTNRSLGSDLEALRSDPDRARREARDLGYVAADEIEVVLPGREKTTQNGESPGSILAFVAPTVLSDMEVKVLALSIAALFLAASLAFRLRGGTKSRAKPSSRRSAAAASDQPGLFPS